LATAIAAVAFVPARERFVSSATRFVYGARQAPDEVLRTFGSRLTRAIPMDELLLQLSESLRKTMGLVSAEVYTGMGEVLERAVSVPDAGPLSLVVTTRERPVVTRAGVSGSAWASVWLPALLDGRAQAQLRVAPISHGGELLGLVVVERAAGDDLFSEDDDACSPIWPARSGWRSTIRSSTRRSRPPSTSCGSKPTHSASPGRALWRAGTPSGDASSAISMTARSSTWWPWPSICAWRAM